MYDEHSLFDLENSEKLKANRYTTHARAEIKIHECLLILDVLITSTLPLLVLRGVFELTSREN